MKDEQPPEWRALQDIYYELSRLEHPLWIALSMHGPDDAIANAVRSGEVPTRGRLNEGYSYSDRSFDRIEKRLNHKARVEVFSNTVYCETARVDVFGNKVYCETTYIDVEGDRPPIIFWIAKNAVPANFVPDECRLWLMTRPEHPRLTKDHAFNKFKATHGRIGNNAFDRAWSAAAHPSWRWPGRPRGK